MRLLFFSRKMDKFDDRMGTYHDYVCRLAKKCEKVVVVCLEKRQVDFPPNVEVHSMGRELGYSKVRCFLTAQKIFWKCVRKVDAIFVHMNPIYTIMISPYAKLFRKPIVTWYGHVAVTPKLKVMDFLSKFVVTSDPTGYRVNSNKVKYIGHGIDTNEFVSKKEVGSNTIVWLGRLTRIKKLEILLEAVRKCVHEKKMEDLNLIIGGEPSGDDDYLSELKQLCESKGIQSNVSFIGKVRNIDAPSFYNLGKISVTLVKFGGPGKTNIESMSCERPVITCSDAFEGIINKYKDILFFKEDDTQDLADKIHTILSLPKEEFGEIKKYVRSQMVKHFEVDAFLDRLLSVLEEARA